MGNPFAHGYPNGVAVGKATQLSWGGSRRKLLLARELGRVLLISHATTDRHSPRVKCRLSPQLRSMDEQPASEDVPAAYKSQLSPNGNGRIMTKLRDFVVQSINPGHVLLATSVISAYSAIQDFRAPTENIVVEQLESSSISNATTSSLKASAKEQPQISHSAAAALANRAFRIATKGNIAVFAMLGAIVCYTSGSDSLEKASHNLKRCARPKEFDSEVFPISRYLKQIFPQLVTSESEKIKNMSEQEEMKYVYEKYLSKVATDDSVDQKDST